MTRLTLDTGRKNVWIGKAEESRSGASRNNRMEKVEERARHGDSVQRSDICNSQPRERENGVEALSEEIAGNTRKS